MKRPKAILDTNIISALLRKHPVAAAHARRYAADYPQFTFSLISQYEVLRGLKIKDAGKQMAAFEHILAVSEVLPLSERVIVRASDIYCDLSRSGRIIEDADILIAATALEHDLVVATDNKDHFSRISGIVIDNWIQS